MLLEHLWAEKHIFLSIGQAKHILCPSRSLSIANASVSLWQILIHIQNRIKQPAYTVGRQRSTRQSVWTRFLRFLPFSGFRRAGQYDTCVRPLYTPDIGSTVFRIVKFFYPRIGQGQREFDDVFLEKHELLMSWKDAGVLAAMKNVGYKQKKYTYRNSLNRSTNEHMCPTHELSWRNKASTQNPSWVVRINIFK